VKFDLRSTRRSGSSLLVEQVFDIAEPVVHKMIESFEIT